VNTDLLVISALALDWAAANWAPITVLIISLAAASILLPRIWRQLGARDPQPDTRPLPGVQEMHDTWIRQETQR
jgi:hypothetical protein